MCDFLLLGENIVQDTLEYRGTYRSTSMYISEMSEDSDVNKWFIWYVQKGGKLGIINNIDKAKKIVTLYEKLPTPKTFEIVRIVKDVKEVPTEEEFIGYDLSDSYHYSLLSWGLEIDNDTTGYGFEKIDPLLSLTKSYFKPKLNKNGLFYNKDDAKFCLDCMMSLQEIKPDLWEGEDYCFEIVGLSIVAC